MPRKSIAALVESDLRYYGEVRLNAMEADTLQELRARIDEKLATPPHTDEQSREQNTLSKAELVAYLLKCKRALCTKSQHTPSLSREQAAKRIQERFLTTQADGSVTSNELPDGERTKLLPSGKDGLALEVTVAKQGDSTRLFKERHELRICSFNSLKLRTGKMGLEDQWLWLLATLATEDVVLIQEVPAQQTLRDGEKTRAEVFKELLEHHSGDTWTMVRSEPCGPGNLEVHEALVRHPIEVISYCTNRTACGVPLDHAPLTLKLKDARFKHEGDRTWVLTSVHFPPKSRARDRDVQINAFMKAYEREAAFRLDTPLTEKGAKDARKPTAHHLVCGDFNCHPGSGFELASRGFAPPLLGEHVSTSAGGEAYDNFIVSTFGANKFSFDADVLELAVPAVPCKGQDGISDHSPIVLKIRDVTSTKDKQHAKRNAA
jgi:endonuclease/exonuclease/phosphatase family metal-dependent hydrolase